jgi:hypothetical protein
MTNDAESLEDQLLYVLAACDEALAAGETPKSLAGPETTPELRPLLEGNLACLQRLQQLRPRPPALRREDAAAIPFISSDTNTIGRFQIRRELGRGGFGVVFQAYDAQLHREVALKVPRADALVTPELRARFHQEARAAACLDHPNIVSVYEAGEIGPICYIAEAYCPGITLAQWLKVQAEPVPEKVTAQLLATLADAVHHAHSRGVLHRDLKPSNILLVSGGVVSGEWSEHHSPLTTHHSPLTPKITDFGLAKLVGPEALGLAAEQQTVSGTFVGTPSYMAPEQAAGKSKEITTAVDTYTLGAILYELLTGRPPFQAETALETLEQVRGQEPVPPRRLRPKLTRDLETICLKCLQKEPAKRYGTAADLAADLRHFLAGESIHARPSTAWERTVKWTKRRPAVAGLLALLAITAGVGFGLVTWKWREAEAALQDKEIARQKEHEERERAEANVYAKLFALARTEWSGGNLEKAKQYLDECDPDLRDEAWHALHRVCHAEVATLRGHAGIIAGLAYAPGGRQLASADGRTIRIWDCLAWRELHSVTNNHQVILSPTYSSDGTRFLYITTSVGARAGATVQILDLQNQKLLTGLDLSPEAGLKLLSPDGNRVLVSNRNTLEILRVADGKALVTLGPFAALPARAIFSSDGSQVAVLQANQFTSIWDGTTGSRCSEFPSPDETPSAFALHAADGRLAVTSSDAVSRVVGGKEPLSRIKIIDARTGRTLANCMGHTAYIQWISFSPDGRYLASASSDHSARIWNTATGAELATLRGHADAVNRVAFSPDGRHLASASSDRTVKIWDVRPFLGENNPAGEKRDTR